MTGPNNPPAFPEVPSDHNAYEGRAGMDLRDWFAGQAMPALLAMIPTGVTQGAFKGDAGLAGAAYAIANAMLAERAKPTASATDMQHVAYFDEGEFHWMSGIAPRDCELYAEPAKGGAA